MRKHYIKTMTLLVAGVILGWSLVFVSSALAQESGADKNDLSSLSYKEGGPPSTFFDYWSQGGTTMWPLMCLMIWTTAVGIELIIKLRTKYFCPPAVIDYLRQALRVKDYQKSWRVAAENPCHLSTIFAEAIEKLPQGKEAVEMTAADTAAGVNDIYKIKNAYISLNATIAPLMGLFGTISGMVGAFNSMAYSGAVGDPTKLAGDIGEALITTYTGLVIAIPAFILYYVFNNRLRKIMAAIQTIMAQLLNEVDYNDLPEVVVTHEMKDEMLSGAIAPAAARPTAKKASTGKVASQPAPAAKAAECPQCHTAITVGMKQCPKCGAEIEWE